MHLYNAKQVINTRNNITYDYFILVFFRVLITAAPLLIFITNPHSREQSKWHSNLVIEAIVVFAITECFRLSQ